MAAFLIRANSPSPPKPPLLKERRSTLCKINFSPIQYLASPSVKRLGDEAKSFIHKKSPPFYRGTTYLSSRCPGEQQRSTSCYVYLTRCMVYGYASREERKLFISEPLQPNTWKLSRIGQGH